MLPNPECYFDVAHNEEVVYLDCWGSFLQNFKASRTNIYMKQFLESYPQPEVPTSMYGIVHDGLVIRTAEANDRLVPYGRCDPVAVGFVVGNSTNGVEPNFRGENIEQMQLEVGGRRCMTDNLRHGAGS